MAEETIAERGRPKGTRTAEVELDTMTFKVTPKLKEWVLAYGELHRRSVSELIREGLEWRISEKGEIAYEEDIGARDSLKGYIKRVADSVESVRTEVRQTIEEFRTLVPLRLASLTPLGGDTPAGIGAAPSTSESGGDDTREGIPPYDPARRVLGKLCKRGHEWGHTGQSLLSKRNKGCLKCEAEKKREKAQREAQPIIG